MTRRMKTSGGMAMIHDKDELLSAIYGNLKGLPEQIEAITSANPLTVVSAAGAGTGKTQTLSQRFAWLLATDEKMHGGSDTGSDFYRKSSQRCKREDKRDTCAMAQKVGKGTPAY